MEIAMSEEQEDYITEAMELLGKGYNHDPIPPNEFVSTISGFTLAPDVIINEYGYVTALVWGVTWRFCQMSDGVCRAALGKIAERLGMSERTIIRHLETLCDGGYLKDTTPNLKNKPHIYADTRKITVRMNLSAGVTESHPAMTESQRQGDRESVEESIKKQTKKEKEAATPRLSSVELEEIKTEANKTVDGILGMEKTAQEKEQAGIAWRGRELCPPNYIMYGDWWHSKTKQHMYGAKGKAKLNIEWLKAFKEFYENDVPLSVLDEAYNAEIAWKKIVSKPSELVTKAIAIAALPSAQPQTETAKSPFDALFSYLQKQEGVLS